MKKMIIASVLLSVFGLSFGSGSNKNSQPERRSSSANRKALTEGSDDGDMKNRYEKIMNDLRENRKKEKKR